MKRIEPVMMTTELGDTFTEQDLMVEIDNKRPDIVKKSPPSTPKGRESILKTKLTTHKRVRFDFDF